MNVLGNVDSLPYYGPELALIGAILLVIVWDLIAKETRSKVYGAVAICLAGLGYSALASASYLATDAEALNLFGGLLAFDDFAHTFRILFAFVSAMIMLFVAPSMLSNEPGKDTGARRNPAEMFMLLMVLTVGMNMMAASRHLLMIYLSLEMVSVISFVLAGYKIRDRKSSEGALKYVIYGGVASGVMLYGMSWIYGLTARSTPPSRSRARPPARCPRRRSWAWCVCWRASATRSARRRSTCGRRMSMRARPPR